MKRFMAYALALAVLGSVSLAMAEVTAPVAEKKEVAAAPAPAAKPVAKKVKKVKHVKKTAAAKKEVAPAAAAPTATK